MLFARLISLRLFLPVLLLQLFATSALAQAGNFATVAIGQTSPAQTVTLTFTGAGTLTKQQALTMGADKQDFSLASGGSCSTGQSYQVGNTCSVSVIFAPLYTGLRMGAVVLEDASGNVLANSYISGIGSGPRAGFHVLTGGASGFPYLGIKADKGIAVDGNGNLFVASYNSSTATESVAELPAGCTDNSCVKQLPGTFYAVWGLAVDGAGNLWIGDVGATGTITEIPAAGGYTTTKVYHGSFGNVVGLAVDGSGNLFFTGSGAASAFGVFEIPAAGGYSTVQTLATGYNTLEGIAVDGAGDVFFSDPSAKTVREIVAVNGSIPASPTIKNAGSGLNALQFVAVDGSGDLYATSTASNSGAVYQIFASSGYTTQKVLSLGLNAPTGVVVTGGGDLFFVDSNSADGGAVFEITRAVVPALTFATPTAPGLTDTADGPHKVALENIGNQPLAISSLVFSNANFSFDSSTTTCDPASTLSAGDDCQLGIQFNPIATGDAISGTLAVTDNSGNAPGAKQTLALLGAGLYTPAMQVGLSSKVVAVSQALTVTLTLGGASGKPVPTGTVQLAAPGYTSSAVAVINGVAPVTIPSGTLTPGTITLGIVYAPDTASASVYTSASTQAKVTVTSTIMNVPTVTVTPAVRSVSLGQALTVTVGVSQTSGSPMPTGTVSLAGGNYTSPATPLNSGGVTITIPANSLIVGTDQLIATYTPDAASAAIYLTAQGQGFVAVSAAVPPSGAPPADFGSLPIGQTSASQLVTLTFPANATPASLVATTQGATGKDFAIVDGGSCGAGINVASGQSCTVNVTLTPAVAGLRNGAVMALDANGQSLALTYVHGSGTGPQISIQSDRYFAYNGLYASNNAFSFTTISDGFSHPNVAVDGAGNVFVADWGNQVVRKIPAGCTSASCTVTVMTGVWTPSAVAVDGAGNIFVAESGYGDVRKIPPGCSSPSCMQTVGTGFNQPYGITVDSSGNLFVADTFNNAIKEVVAEGGYSTIKTLATGLDLPWSVVVNAADDLFVAEGGDECTVLIPGSCVTINTSLVQITAASNYQTVNTIASGVFGKPFGVAIDGAGNVYEADYGDGCATEYPAGSGYTTAHRLCSNSLQIYPEGLAVDSRRNLYLDDVIRGAVYKLDYVGVPPMSFNTATLQGVSDVQDGPQIVSVQNNGTAPLTFSSMNFSDTSFKLNASLNTCSTSTPLAAGSSCYLAVDFAPTKTGPINATLTLTDNDLNQSPTTQVIPIIAVALPPTPVILTTPPNPTTASTATFTFSDTQTPITFVCSIDSLPFSACSSPATFTSLNGGPHAFQVKARDTAGNLSLAAIYNWTQNSVGPPTPTITSAPALLTNDDTATFAFTDSQAGVTYQCSLDGVAFATCTSGISYSGLAGFPNNYYINTKRHSFGVKAMDGAGNFSPAATLAWTTISIPISAYPQDFGPVPVGQTSSVQNITFTITTAGTLTNIKALTMGSPGLDFAVTDPGTCTTGTALAKGATCTLKATFAPKYPGQRRGGILLLDAAGNGLGEGYVLGTGTGPQVTFTPYTTVFYNILTPQNNTDPGKNLVAPVSDVALDGAGNVYAADENILSVDQSVSVSAGDIWKFPVGCTGPTCSTLVASTQSTQPPSPVSLVLPTGLTMDGIGILWVDNYYLWPQDYHTTGTWFASQCTLVPGSTTGFERVGVDAAGNIAMVGNGLLQSCYQNLGAGQTSQTTSFDFSSNTPSVAVDPAGNFFVTDTGNNAIKEVLSSSNYTISRIVGSGFSKPGGVASDAYGNIYVSDSGNNALKEIVAASGYTQVLTLATFDPAVITPQNLVVDGQGNIYIATSALNVANSNPGATNQFVKLDFSDAPALNFRTATMIGTTDTVDGTLIATVKNTGNQPLTIGGLALSNTNFSIDAGATTCSASAPLAVGSSCSVGITFTPNGTGALTGTLTLTDNALNVGGATQIFQLTGTAFTTATVSTPTVTVLPASGSITTSETDAVTVTVAGTSGSATPTGTIALFGGTYTSAIVPLSAGSATFTIPAGILAVGSTTLNAVYTPDAASSAIYGTGAGSASITVTALSASTPVVMVTPASIDVSTQQSLAVTIAVLGTPTPTGSVTLSGGNYASLATVLSNGTAIITIPSGYLPAGTVTLTAYYTPDQPSLLNYNSASGTGQVAVEAAVKATPAVLVTPASSSITTSQSLQVTMQVSGGSGKPSPTGSIVLSSGTYTSANAMLSQGTVTLSIPAGALAAGSDTLTATYTPDNASTLTFNSAAGTNSVTVNAPVIATSTVLQTSATSVITGVSVTFTASVAETSGSTIPTGTVTFFDGASPLGTSTLNTSGAATFSTSILAIGTHSISATYGGDTGNSASTSPALTVTVNPLTAQTINFTQPTSPVTYSSGLQIPLVATGGASGNPVVFTLDASSTGSGTIAGSTLNVNSVGTFVIDANQAGNATYAAAAQVQRTVVVNALIAQAISFTQPTSPVTYSPGLQIPLIATGGESGNPVVFTLDASSTATASITGTTLTATSVGTLVIDANQAGNATYSAAPQVQRTVVINQASQAINFTQPTTPVVYSSGLQISLSATGGASGNPVVFTLDATSTGNGAISGSTLTVTGAGNLVINANQAGNAFYSSAPQVQRTLVVTTDFSVTATPPSQTVARGASAQYAITLTNAGGTFGNAVTFSISGLPSGATATFAPPSLTPGSGNGTSTLTIQTAATMGRAASNFWPLSTPLVALIFVLPFRRWRHAWSGKLLLLIIALASLAGAASLTGCGGGWRATPLSQTSTITITGTSGSATHSTTVQLTVQ